MKPKNKKNYGSNACALLVIPCQPPVLVIVCTDGTIYHSVLMDQDNEKVSLAFFLNLHFIALLLFDFLSMLVF